MNTIDQIINRIKRLEQFVVKVSVPEDFALRGAVPFDIEIAGSTAMVTVWAASEAEAQRRAEEFFNDTNSSGTLTRTTNCSKRLIRFMI